MVKILAGLEAKEFTVHKEFACHYSPVLKATFNSNFIEGQTQTYNLDDIEVEVVRLLVHWLYTQSVGVPSLDIEQNEKLEATIMFELSQL